MPFGRVYGEILGTRWYGGATEKWYLIPSEGVCQVTLRIHAVHEHKEGWPVVVLLRQSAYLNTKPSKYEAALMDQFVDRGISVAAVGLCGLDEDHTWHSGLGEFAPFLISRTHVGFHSGEVLRAVRFVAGLGFRALALVAMEDTASAALHAAIQERHALVAVVISRCILSYASIATAHRHQMPWLMQMFGVLKKYDLPDLVASLAVRGGPRALVSAPQDALKQPLDPKKTKRLLQLARLRFVAAGGILSIRHGMAFTTSGQSGVDKDSAEAKVVAEFVEAAQAKILR